MRDNLFWLSDEQWERIERHLPTDVRGVEREDDRRVISGIIHVLKTGCRWCDCPPEYGPHTTIYNLSLPQITSGRTDGAVQRAQAAPRCARCSESPSD